MSIKQNRKKIFIIAFTFNFILSNSPDNNIKPTIDPNSTTNSSEKFFWGSDENSELNIEFLNNLLALFNTSLKLKISTESFKLTLKKISSKIKELKQDLKEKEKLQNNLEIIVDNISDIANNKSTDLIALANLLNKLS